jgi:cbb3-type cytochrome oxidase maturation protein
MTDFLYLVSIALSLGVAGLAAFMWSLKSGQYEDLDGAAERILFDDDDTPLQKNSPQTPDAVPTRPSQAETLPL